MHSFWENFDFRHSSLAVWNYLMYCFSVIGRTEASSLLFHFLNLQM